MPLWRRICGAGARRLASNAPSAPSSVSATTPPSPRCLGGESHPQIWTLSRSWSSERRAYPTSGRSGDARDVRSRFTDGEDRGEADGRRRFQPLLDHLHGGGADVVAAVLAQADGDSVGEILG